MASVDTGSAVTLMRPNILPTWTVLQPTTVQLRTVTGERAPMKGKGLLSICVGRKTVLHAVQDPCILGLDFLRCTGWTWRGGRLASKEGPQSMWPRQTPPTSGPNRQQLRWTSHTSPAPFTPLQRPSNYPVFPIPVHCLSPPPATLPPPSHPLVSMFRPLQTTPLPLQHPTS